MFEILLHLADDQAAAPGTQVHTIAEHWRVLHKLNIIPAHKLAHSTRQP